MIRAVLAGPLAVVVGTLISLAAAPGVSAQDPVPPPAVAGTDSLPPATPAPLPPAPRMLADPQVVSPYALPAPDLRPMTELFSPHSGDEPLWVLPPEVIPPGVGPGGAGPDGENRVPAADDLPSLGTDPLPERVRVPGYLDSPEDIHLAGRSPDELVEGQLHEGLPWEFCGPRPPRLGPAPLVPELPEDTPVEADAGGLTYHRDTQLLTLGGGVTLTRGSQRVVADVVSYNRTTGDVLTSGRTLLDYPGVRIIGSRAELNLPAQTGRIYDAHYRFTGSLNLRGNADLAEMLNPRLTRYSNITYTACRPGVNAWSLRARDLELNQDSGRGIAHHARLRIAGIPVLYTPYLDFPIDDRRKSGFLIPSVGMSSRSGFELMTPWYWNIAPQVDATFYPRYMSERGVMLGTEVRYLTRRDSGTVQFEWIPDDAKYQDGGSRGALHVEQHGQFFGRWATLIDYNAVSDDEYLRDFGTTLDMTSTWYLPQRASLTYWGAGGWFARTLFEAFQTVDPNTRPQGRPYGRLPQLLFGMPDYPLANGLVLDFDAEFDWFDHNHLVNGQRFALMPTLSWPLRRSFGHLIPRALVQLSQYALNDVAPGQGDSPGHVIPTFDLDGRLVFERPLQWFGATAIQTLEPRLYYLYTPYVDQNNTPVFDSSPLDFSFSNLYRNNRFTGRDRIGDANQITVGLTSRILGASTGQERFRVSFGQIFYFADRRVRIVPGPPETGWRSPYAAEFAAQLSPQWFGRASLEWDPDSDSDDQWGRRTVQLQYRNHDASNLLNLAYRYNDGVGGGERFEDVDLSFRLGLDRELGFVGRWLYSLERGVTSDAFAGVEFGQCCWKVRVLGRHSNNGIDEAPSSSVMLQLELAGLGAFGNPVNRFLQEEIYGYQVE